MHSPIHLYMGHSPSTLRSTAIKLRACLFWPNRSRFQTGSSNHPCVDVKPKAVWSFVLHQTKTGSSNRPNHPRVVLVLRAGCGILLYQFLIVAYLFTLVCPNICSLKNKIWRQQNVVMKFIAQKWLFLTKHCCFLLFIFSSMTHWCLPDHIIRSKVWLLHLP